MTNDQKKKGNAMAGDVVHSDKQGGHKNAPTRSEKKYDLAERTARFGESVIGFCKKVPRNVITIPLIDQLVRSATSVGANYCEADEAFSRRDFRHAIGICKKEANEAGYWLRMMVSAEETTREEARILWCESQELRKIFASIFRRTSLPK